MAIRLRAQATSLGRFAGVIANQTAAFTGSATNPVTRTGTITAQLAPLTSAVVGFFTPAPNRTGTIGASLGTVTASIQGSAFVPGSASDVTTFSVLGSGTQYVTFGHPFIPGAINSSQGAVVTNGSNVPVASQQCVKQAAHADGSLRHAIITAQLVGGQSYKIRASTPSSSTPPANWKASLVSALGTSNVVFSSGITATFDIAATVNSQPDDLWISGPACAETRVFQDVSTGIRAYADVRYHADGTVKLDIGIENPWVYGGLRADRSYTFQITAFGAAQSATAVSHRANTRIRKTFHSSGGTLTPVHNVTYLKLTKAVPNYSFPTAISAVTSTTFANLPQAVSTLASGGYGQHFETGGLDNGIGPCPHHQAVFLMNNSDARAWTSVRDQVVGGGAFAMHARDAATGNAVRITDHPNGGWGSGNDFSSGGTQPGPSDTLTFSADCAHMPSIAYVPYVVTGDRWALDELCFWANWALLTSESSISDRGGATGRIQGARQTRGVAWSLREVGRAAYILPDGHALKAYFATILDTNATNYTANYTVGQPRYNNFGALDQNDVDGSSGSEQTRFHTKTWMDDFVTWSVNELVAMGFTNWQTFADFKNKFPIGRIGGTEFPFMAMGQDMVSLCGSAGGAFYTTWTQVSGGPGEPTGLTILSPPNSGNPTVTQGTQLNASGELPGAFAMGIPRGYPPLPGSRFGTGFIAAAAVVDRQTAGWERMWGRMLAATKIQNSSSPPPRPNWVDDQNGGAANAVWPRIFTTTGVPNYIGNIANNQCQSISGSSLSSSGFSLPSGMVADIGAIAHAYSGAVWDRKRSQYIIFGGGHNDTNYNGVPVFRPYSSETPTWQLLVASSNPVPALGGGSPAYSDGKPSATHTYSLIVVDTTRDKFMLMGLGSLWASNGGESNVVRGLDLATNVWDSAATYASIPLVSGQALVQGCSAVYDEHDGVMWGHRVQGGGLYRYDPVADSYTTNSSGSNFIIDFVSAINPWHRYMISIGGYANNGPWGGGGSQLIITDLNTRTSTARTCTGLPSNAKWGLEYHPPSNTFVAWNSGQTVYQLTPPTDPFSTNWTATSFTMTGSTAPTSGNIGAGTYSKFRWAPYPNDPTKGVFIFFGVSPGDPHTTTNVFLWRPPF